MNPEPSRQHTTEIEINATPDQVFRAVSEAEEIQRWFAPYARVEPGPDGMVGGTYSVSWSPEMEGGSTIAIYEPGRRFATTSERATPYGAEPQEGEPVQRIMVDYQIEAIEGGKTRLRLVHSGFGRGAGWDNEIESTRTGWAIFVQVLKHGLERHPGVDSVTMYVMLPCALPAEEVCRRLVTVEKSAYRVRASTALEIHGEVIVAEPPATLIGVAEEWNQALAGLYREGKFVNLVVVLYGPARALESGIKAAWEPALAAALA